MLVTSQAASDASHGSRRDARGVAQIRPAGRYRFLADTPAAFLSWPHRNRLQLFGQAVSACGDRRFLPPWAGRQKAPFPYL